MLGKRARKPRRRDDLPSPGAAGGVGDGKPGGGAGVTLLLRPMVAADIGAVAVMEEALFGLEAWPARMLAGELRGRDGGARYYLVAEENGAVAGYGGLLAPRGGPGDIVTLAVARHRWGAGIGTSLLLGLLAEAARRGCREVFLEVRVDNDRAQRLYRRHGFAGVGVRRGYYQPSGTDALVMRRELAAPAAPARPAAAGRLPAAPPPAATRRGPGLGRRS